MNYWWCIGILCLLNLNSFGQADLDKKLDQDFKFVGKWIQEDPDKAMKRMESSLAQMQNEKYIYGEWSVQRTISDIFEHQHKMEEALIASKKALEIAKKMKHIRFQGYSYLNLSGFYMSMGRFKKAKEVAEKAADIFIELDSVSNQILVLGNLGTIYLQLGESEKALASYQKSYTLADSLGDEKMAIKGIENIGYFHLMRGDGKAALPYIKKGLEHNLRRPGKSDIAASYGNLAYTHSLMGNYSEAFKNYQYSVDTAQKYNLKQIEYTTYKDMSDTYSKSGNYQKSLEYLNKHYTLKDSIVGVKAQQRINDLEVEFVTKEKEKENQILKQDKQLQQFQIIGLILGLILLGIIAVLAIRKKNNDIQKKEELIDKNTEIHRLEKQLVENQLTQKKLEQEKTLEELRYKKLEQDKILKELGYKNQRLTDFALDISQKNKIAETLNIELDLIEGMKIPKSAKDKLRNLRQIIDTNLQINKERAAFQENFDVLLVEFNQKLEQQYPELTKKDIMLCGFLRLGLENKEIATIRSISTNSVRMARYRLRKKLNIAAEVNIEQFLKEL